jgi:hypothetical protein
MADNLDLNNIILYAENMPPIVTNSPLPSTPPSSPQNAAHKNNIWQLNPHHTKESELELELKARPHESNIDVSQVNGLQNERSLLNLQSDKMLASTSTTDLQNAHFSFTQPSDLPTECVSASTSTTDFQYENVSASTSTTDFQYENVSASTSTSATGWIGSTDPPIGVTGWTGETDNYKSFDDNNEYDDPASDPIPVPNYFTKYIRNGIATITLIGAIIYGISYFRRR